VEKKQSCPSPHGSGTLSLSGRFGNVHGRGAARCVIRKTPQTNRAGIRLSVRRAIRIVVGNLVGPNTVWTSPELQG